MKETYFQGSRTFVAKVDCLEKGSLIPFIEIETSTVLSWIVCVGRIKSAEIVTRKVYFEIWNLIIHGSFSYSFRKG